MGKLRVGSMFAGIGGIDLGFEQAGFKIVWANEIDKHACYTYKMNFCEDYLVEGDIQNVNVCSISDFDVLVAGFPCQAFSAAGLEKGFEDPRGNLFFETARIIAAKKPKVVFFENVANLIKHDSGKTFMTIYHTLAELGYYVKYKVMNASDYGIPQQRNRIYIVAFLDEQNAENYVFPKEKKMKHDAFYFFDKDRKPEQYYMDGHKKWDEMVEYMTDIKRIYRFTDWGISKSREGICPTLLAAMGSPYERIPFFFDEYSIRKITQREAARLQGFPDTFQLPIDKIPKQVYKQIGNSVCVPIIKDIAKNIKRTLLREAQRNRAEGWKHAKHSGHINEVLVERLTENDSSIQSRLLECVNKTNCSIEKIDVGGLNEKDVDCVLGGKTKSKTDMHIYLSDGSKINVSIKKSLNGQVYLIRDARFIEGFEKQFNKNIPNEIKRAISLFWGSAEDISEIISQYGTKKTFENRKHRVVASTLQAYSNDLYCQLISWFNENINEIFDFCFSCGLAADNTEWANVIWYNNQLKENNLDELISIEYIKSKLSGQAEYGTRGGGTTIALPFGFVQWHQGQMQFHHQYKKIKKILEND